MALSANQNRKMIDNLFIDREPLASGAITVYRHALMNYKSGSIGYLKLGADVLSDEFAGLALEAKTLAAGDNLTDGAHTIEIHKRGSGKHFELPVRSNITIANINDKVYVDGDDYVDIASGIVNTTGGFVGIIRAVTGTNSAFVQLTDDVA